MFHVKQCTKAAAWAAGGRGELRRQLSASVGAASAASGFGGSFPLRSARLRLLRASLGAGRCSSSGFGCSPLLGLLGFGRRWAASLCFASLRHPSPRHPSRYVCLRPHRFRSAAPLRPPLPSPLPSSATSSRLHPPLPSPLPSSATSSRLRPPLPSPLPSSATSSRLRCCPLPPKLLPLCIVSRETFILHCFTWNILHCFTWNIIVYYKLFHVKHYRLLNNLQTHQSNSIFANNH